MRIQRLMNIEIQTQIPVFAQRSLELGLHFVGQSTEVAAQNIALKVM